VLVSSRSLRYVTVVFIVLFLCAGVGAQNLIADSGFELSARNPRGGPWIARGEGADLKEGAGRLSHDQDGNNHAARLVPLTDYGSEWMQAVLSLKAGVEYVLSAWVRLQDDTPAQASLGIRMRNSYPRIYRGLSGDGWERIELAFTAEEGWAQIVLSSTAGALVYWDDVTLHQNVTVTEQLARLWESRLREKEQPLYTGLVVDARGIGLERGMSPRIYDTSGRLIFAGEGYSHDQLIRRGIAAYVRSLEDATTHSRLAVSPDYPMRLPLVLDAQQAIGLPPTAVVVGEEDGRRIRQATDQYDFLGRFAIIFVVD
jgi:hypothetical protein